MQGKSTSNSQAHMFNVQIATDYGVNEAILLNNLFFWVQHAEANDKNHHDGRYWTYNSTRAFEKIFPYFTAKQIRTILGKLEKHGLIVTGNYNQSAYDRTKWYALTEKALAYFQPGNSISPNGQMDETERENGFSRKGEPIPDNKPDDKPIDKPIENGTREGSENSTPENKAKKKAEPKRKYGEFGHVMLTDSEHVKLMNDFPNDHARMIRDLDEYLEQHPRKSYANHSLTMRKWKRRDDEKAQTEGKTPIVTRDPSTQPKWGGLINV